MKIPKENQCRLGESPETGSLGINAVVGERKYEVQLKFRIRMGPMELVDLQRLVPIGDSFKRLKDWVLNYVNQEFYLGSPMRPEGARPCLRFLWGRVRCLAGRPG